MQINLSRRRLTHFVRVYPREAIWVADARKLTETMVTTWGFNAGMASACATVMSELAGNAVQHGAGAQMVIRAVLKNGRPRLEVWDDSPDQPTARTPSEDDEHGRGLLMVHWLSNQFGVDPPATGHSGKIVWAEM